jgi:hypothetical protein
VVPRWLRPEQGAPDQEKDQPSYDPRAVEG